MKVSFMKKKLMKWPNCYTFALICHISICPSLPLPLLLLATNLTHPFVLLCTLLVTHHSVYWLGTVRL